MKLNLWISLPLSMICVIANAQGTASTTTTTATTAPATTAAPAAATSTAKVEAKKEAPIAKYGASYYAGYGLQAQTQEDGTRSQSIFHMFTLTAGYGDYNSSATMFYDQDLIDSSGSAWGDLALGLSKKAWVLGDYLKLGPSISLGLPMTNATRNEVGLQYSVGGGLKLSLNTKNLGLDSFSLAHQVSLTKFFTNFDTNAKTGAPNTSHRLRNQTTIGYNISEDWSVSGLFRMDSSYSVNGIITNSFYLLQSVDYQVNEAVSVGLSHSNSGPYLNSKKDYENNLKVYDSENSSYSASIEVSL